MAQKTIQGTLTIPTSELKLNGFYTDLTLNLILVTGGTENIAQSSSVATNNKYSFTYDDAGVDLAKVQLKRNSNGAILGESRSRGVLPRSFLTSTTDVFYTDNKHNSFTFDAGLAILACTGGEYSALSKEIVEGVLKATSTSEGVPFVANHVSPQGATQELRTSTVAMVAYALGYYLEKNPLASNTVAVADELNNTLKLLLSLRDTANYSSLIKAGQGRYVDGVFQLNQMDNNFYSVDNLLSYFAFKQAGYVVNEVYLEVAEELAIDLKAKLYNPSTKKFYKGILEGGAKVLTDELEANVLGAFFFIEENDVAKAEELALNIENNFSLFENILNIAGYKATSTDTKLWVEGSYAVASLHYQLGDTLKYNVTVKDLNKMLDVDGSFKYGTIKDGQQKVLEYKSVASTAWSYIANTIPDEVFSININASMISGATPYFINHTIVADYQKNDCATGTGTTITYKVYPGHFNGTSSQAAVDLTATNYANTNGQAYANGNGTCEVPYSFFNVERNMLFASSGCTSGSRGVVYPYSIPAGAFGSHISQEHANALADAKLIKDGQAYADNQGLCQLEKHLVDISIEKSVVSSLNDDDVYGTIYSSEPVDTLVNVSYEFTIDGSAWTGKTISLYTGSSNSYSFYMTTVPYGSGENVQTRITNVTPSEYSSQLYNYPTKVITYYYNDERSAYFIKECGAVGINSNSIVRYAVASGATQSIISVEHANVLADAQVAANGQQWANDHGYCDGVSIYLNQRQSQVFTKEGCSTGYTAQSMEYVVEAGTYESTVSLDDANNLALADIAANGQDWVNARTSCVLNSNTVTITLVQSVDQFGTYDKVYIQAKADKAVTSDVNVYFDLTQNGVVEEGAGSSVILNGQTWGSNVMARQVNPGEGWNVTASISFISPTSDASSTYIKG